MFERGSLDPEGVGVAQEKRIAPDRVKRALDGSPLIEELLPLVRNDDLRGLAAGEMRFDLIGQPWTLTIARSTPFASRRSRL